MSNEAPKATFWMVYGYKCDRPKARHKSLDKARAEATRLAVKHPGISFVILQSVEVVLDAVSSEAEIVEAAQ